MGIVLQLYTFQAARWMTTHVSKSQTTRLGTKAPHPLHVIYCGMFSCYILPEMTQNLYKTYHQQHE